MKLYLLHLLALLPYKNAENDAVFMHYTTNVKNMHLHCLYHIYTQFYNIYAIFIQYLNTVNAMFMQLYTIYTVFIQYSTLK